MEILKSVIDFLIVTVILKAIIAHWLAERLTNYLKNSSERNLAIWLHYQTQAAGKGHNKSILRCIEEKCAVLGA